jgi:hypothetical protein
MQIGPRHLENASFNHFSFVWTAGAGAGPSECGLLVRFHFLSTDFTQSKGVKGVPVRLCAKTELISPPASQSETGSEAEICYCRVKVFRDHGAERKLANDIEHIKKSIQRVEKQINRVDGDRSTNGKRTKRKKSAAPSDPMSRSASRSSSVSTQGDLYRLLYDLHKRFTSALPVSVLALQGDEHDDLDQLAASLTLATPTSTQSDSADTRSDSNSDGRSDRSSRRLACRPLLDAKVTSVDPPPGKIHPVEDLAGQQANLSVVACFYINVQCDGRVDDYYRAIYLTQRTVRELVSHLSKHSNIQPKNIARVVHVNQTGLPILVDDDVVQNILEGQDMIANFVETPAPNCAKDEAPGLPSFEVRLIY